MISVIITAYKEEKTIGRAIEAILSNRIKEKTEIIIICPDKATADIVKKYQKKNNNIVLLKDKREGKPAALNQTFKKAKGDILLLTDGDVFIGKNALKEMVNPFKNPKVGAVTGRPVSVSPKDKMLGYWSHLLTDVGAHETRTNLAKKGKFIVCSGYLYAFRSGIIKKLDPKTLSEDAVISSIIAEKGYKIHYSPLAKVYVKYPTHLTDWIKQKRRSTGGYLQINQMAKSKKTMRSFLKESAGIFRAFSYSKNIKEFFWVLLLIIARIYLWALIFIDIKLGKRNLKKPWPVIESTK